MDRGQKGMKGRRAGRTGGGVGNTGEVGGGGLLSDVYNFLDLCCPSIFHIGRKDVPQVA